MTDTTEDLRQAIEDAASKIHAAYWVACDASKAAIDPRDVTDDSWAIDMLDEAYDIALRISEDPLGWEEGRQKW